MRTLLCSCALSALLIGNACAGVLPRPTPIVVTLDGHDYVTFVSPLVLSPVDRLVLAPESSMANCRRVNGEAFASGSYQLDYALNGAKIAATAMRIEFRPTRLILDSQFGDVICDGQAGGGVTGVGRVFRDEFEQDGAIPPA